MKVAILGAGNAGCAVAADLTLKGHQVTLIKTSHAMHDDNFEYIRSHKGKMVLEEFGNTKIAYIDCVTRDLKKISENEVIIIYIQTNYHEKLIKKIIPYLRDGQLLLLNPGYLSTAYTIKHLRGANKNIIIAEAESSFIDGRIIAPGIFRVGFRNVRNPVGIYPLYKLEEAKKILDKLDEKIVYLDSVVEAALNNPNLIVHTVGSIMSIPRIEQAEDDFCMYHEAYTRKNQATWRILDALDNEKMQILDSLGMEKLSYVNACKYRNSLDDDYDAKEVFLEYAEMETRAKGPTKVDSRYISEDVPEGLVMLESLGKLLNINTPIATSLIEVASAALNRDLRREGRTVSRLGYDNIKLILEECKIKE